MPQIITNLNEVSSIGKQLLESALFVAPRAYNTYSKFYVGAAVMTRKGQIYSGTFLDNVSTGLTICAEVAAIMNANTMADFDIVSIAVVGGEKINEDGAPITPCGRCRQIIFEASKVSKVNIEIYCSNMNLSNIIITNISELLPYPFGRST